MARIFITGSSDGLGSLAAQRLIKNGHTVVLHARNAQRAQDARKACPGADDVLVADLSSLREVKELATEANKKGAFDAVVHNAGIYRGGGGMGENEEGGVKVPAMVRVNTLAPYLLACLMHRPRRLVFLSSGLHTSGRGELVETDWDEGRWSDGKGYADTKMHNVMFAKAFARKWGDTVEANSMDPGWVATKMGGAGAPGDIGMAVETYVKLVEGPGKSGGYFKPGGREAVPGKASEDVEKQERLLKACEDITGVKVPE